MLNKIITLIISALVFGIGIELYRRNPMVQQLVNLLYDKSAHFLKTLFDNR